MDKRERGTGLGIIGGMAGAAFGAYLWAVILGIVIREPLLAILAILAGIATILIFIKFWNAFPARKLTAIGIAVLFLVIPNVFFANIYYDKIPDTLYKGENAALANLLATNKGQLGPLFINIFLGAFIAAGIICILTDIFQKRRK